ncbi:protein SHORT ROOT IN SALT MEDIUM 1 [Capsicum chacoense]
MYPSRGSNVYGQQSYSSQSSYGQSLGHGYSGSSAGGPERSSQLPTGSRHSSILGPPQDAEMSAYTTHGHHPSTVPNYGGQYSSVYGSTAQQMPTAGGKGSASSALESRSGFGVDSPKFTAGDYVSSSSHGYGHKAEQQYSDRITDYPTLDRHQYVERHSSYGGRDLTSEQASRYPDSISFGLKHQAERYEHMDQASIIRQEQILKSQALQSPTVDGGSRQVEYLAARSAAVCHAVQDPISYSGRIDSGPRTLSTLLAGQHAPSILGAAPQRAVEDVMYVQNSTNPGYGVSLPPGRDYGIGKGLHATSVDPDYPSSVLAHAGHSRLDDYKDVYSRELERREKDRHSSREREKDRERAKDRERERDRDREREREWERERDRERERERDRERERERQRQRERDRERALERKEKEKDHKRKRGAEVKHDRTPPRSSRDRRGSSLSKDSKSTRRESPRPDVLHRHHTPVKRREYFCKVYSSSLVEIERDYLSLDRRYPRLFISPECSKVVVNWPKGNLKLSLHTPVSFEHDFVEGDAATALKRLSSKPSAGEPEKSEPGTTIWNAKVILMSGLSRNSLEELSSDRNYDDRIPHVCNLLRFAVLKLENSLMTIGGQWDSVDGGDPSCDDSSLIQTALRHAKDIANLDLKNCQQWNRFLEIHYERVGKDGLFSHKEVTVYFVPDLSECLPSLESWREHWSTKKKAIAEREKELALRKEKSGEKESQKDAKQGPRSERNSTAGLSAEGCKKENDGRLKENIPDKEGSEIKVGESKQAFETSKVVNDNAELNPGKSAAIETDGSAKSVKKRIIKRIVKQKVSNKKDLETTQKVKDKVDCKETGEGNMSAEIASPLGESATPPVKTFTRKKIVKKVPMVKTPTEDGLKPPDIGIVKEAESSEDKVNSKTGGDSTSVKQDAVVKQDTVVKKTVKRKIIKRVPKRKAASTDTNNGVTGVGSLKDDVKEEKLVQAKSEVQNVGNNNAENAVCVNVVNQEQKVSPKTKSKIADVKQETKEEINLDGSKKVSKTDKLKGKEGPKETGKKDKDGKILSKSKSTKEIKEKRSEDPPRHPGFFLQTKGSKDMKLRSLSLSLDSLLDYTDKDIEESRFELSLVAESLYEMVYYNMASRLLPFLQKLRSKFLIKRNQQKRQREESSKKKGVEKSAKRTKTDERTEDAKSVKTESDGKHDQEDEKSPVKEEVTSLNNAEETMIPDEDANDDSEMDEDPEEDPEEESEMQETSPQDGHAKEAKENAEEVRTDADTGGERTGNSKDGGVPEIKPILKSGSKEETTKVEKSTKTTLGEVGKELLQAFRFFDRNRAGFIRVEDMRLILHNLGKFLSHRDVKELVQSALIESNTGRDDRILYKKLINMDL